MKTRYLVDPELVVMLDQFPTLELTNENLGQALKRALLDNEA